MENSEKDLDRQMNSNHSCPMCGKGKTFPIGRVKDYSFQTCINCELIWSPDITSSFLSELYATGFHGPQDGAPKKGWCRHIDFLNPAFDLLAKDDPLKILDFGTGQNEIPDELRKQGHRVIAVDIAPPLRPHPDRLTGDLINLELEADQFDLVYAFQVFEHLPEPRQLLEEILKLTKPGGLLLIHTDMETTDRAKTDFQNWWYVAPPDHCTFYRNKTFEVFFQDRPHKMVWKAPTSVIIRKAQNLD